MGGSSLRDRLEFLLAVVALVGLGLLVHLSKAKDQAQSPHQTADCTICHVTVADIGDQSFASFDPSAKCRSCHLRLDSPSEPRLTFHIDENRRCLDCHIYHSPDEITVGDRTFQGASRRANRRALCASCHGVGEDPGRLSEGHRSAAGLYHSDYAVLAGLSPSEACMICHSDQSRSELVGSLSLTLTPTFSRHGNHPTGIPVILGRRFANSRLKASLDPDIRLFGGRIECQTCHSLSSTSEFHLIAGTDSNGICRKCHEID